MRKRVMFDVTVRQSASDEEIKLAITTALIASENTLVPDTLIITDAAQGEAHGWLPIATAPKDGSRILVWPYWSDGLAAEVEWRTMKRTEGRWEAAGGLHCPIRPTHWMELPKPPEAAPVAAEDE